MSATTNEVAQGLVQAMDPTDIPGVKSRNGIVEIEGGPLQGTASDEVVGTSGYMQSVPDATPTIEPVKPVLQFTPKAAPFHVRVIVAKDVFEQILDRYWENEKDKIPEHVTRKALKGFRQVTRERIIQVAGGPQRFYRPAIIDYVNGLKQQHDGCEILIWGDLDFILQNDKYIVDSIVYMEPSVKFKSPLPASFKVKLPALDDAILDRMVEDSLQEKRDEHTILTPVEDTDPAVMGQFVVVSGTAKFSARGERWEPGNFKNKKMLLTDSLPKPILDAVLAARRGMTQVFIAKLSDFNGYTAGTATHGQVDPEQDREIKGTIVVHEVFNRQVPEVNDDFAISCGFETLAQMRTQLRRQVEDSVVAQREQMSMAMVFMQIMSAIEVSPVPDLWANVKAREIFFEQREFFKSEEQLLAQTGAKTVDELVARNSQDVRSTLVRQLALRAYGISQDVEGDKTLAATHLYSQTVQAQILKTLEVEDIEAPKEK